MKERSAIVPYSVVSAKDLTARDKIVFMAMTGLGESGGRKELDAEVACGLREISKACGVPKSSVVISVWSLIRKRRLEIVSMGVGSKPTVYRFTSPVFKQPKNRREAVRP